VAEEIDDDFFLSLAIDSDPLATQNTVELISSLGALSPRGGPFQDPALTLGGGGGEGRGKDALAGKAQKSHFMF